MSNTLAPLPVRDASAAPSPDARLLRGLVLAGMAGVVAVWISEALQGQLARWDRVLYPVALVWLALTHAALTWQPRWEPVVRLLAVLILNAIVLLEIGFVVATGWPELDLYQLFAALLWIPLGLGCAFVFLSMRLALVIAGLVYACEFLPLLWLYAVHGPIAHWPAFVPALLANAAVVQPLYVLMLVGISRMHRNVQRAHERTELLQRAASTDALTGLANRRALDEWLATLLESVRLDPRRATVFLIDVDHFKAINDGHGHDSGDAVLVELARLLASQVRAGDRVGRWGGEEFLAVLHDIAPPAALELADRLRAAVAAHEFPRGLRVTVSIGVTPCEAGDRPDSLLKRADDALYAAKSGGRNRVHPAPQA